MNSVLQSRVITINKKKTIIFFTQVRMFSETKPQRYSTWRSFPKKYTPLYNFFADGHTHQDPHNGSCTSILLSKAVHLDLSLDPPVTIS
jgi:hypothetical protein